MPITLIEIASNTANVRFTWGANEVNIVYRPGLVTEKVLAQLMDFTNLDESTLMAQMREFNELLARLMVSWDVMDGEVVVPITPDRLSEIPILFRAEVIQAMLGDIRPEAMTPQMNGAH
jgi:hypothetical protein